MEGMAPAGGEKKVAEEIPAKMTATRVQASWRAEGEEERGARMCWRAGRRRREEAAGA